MKSKIRDFRWKSPRLGTFCLLSSKSAQNIDFFEKLWKLYFLEKSIYPSDFHEIEVWWPRSLVLTIPRLRTRLKIVQGVPIEANCRLVNSRKNLILFLPRAVPRACRCARMGTTRSGILFLIFHQFTSCWSDAPFWLYMWFLQLSDDRTSVHRILCEFSLLVSPRIILPCR